jgi:tRNA nucleotidyltransferase (CCA-adding enzyme)
VVSVVGGAVRDLLLGRSVRDLDVVIEGDAPGVAGRLARELGASLRTHERFGTTTVTLPGGETLDVAAARSETYPRPGALPVVTLGATLAEDLARRDFTIHAMAAPLGRRMRLVDPFGGREDLKRQHLRILHPRSFLDDPTRALRLGRYASRLGFRPDPSTRRLLAEALASRSLDTISADRLRREVRLLLEEPHRAATVALLRRLGLDGAIHPALASRPEAVRLLRRAEATTASHGPPPGWLCYLLAWMGKATAADTESLADRLGLSGDDRRRVRAWPETLGRISALAASDSAAAVRRAVRSFSPDEVVAAASFLPPAAARKFLDAARRADPALSIGGFDLIAAGIPSGPRIGRALEMTRQALEEGRIGRSEELAFALRVARETRE